ncbi:hypothetical protein SAMN05444338_1077 [Flavobacterium degerlachei]|uniref:Uncharacterized protein n=2 Tax=Flavobacterium degerlachei TaxID=229203 RepID=A0A1H2YVE5_9FLAO|nr:hypothetical protein SAMN05444338_1077 [Flavobacterium degerlachei]
MILIVALFFGVYYLARFVSTANIQIKMDELGIKITWAKQFLLQKRSDFEIEWIDIKEFKIEPDRNWDKFKIISKYYDKFEILHNTDYDGKDDYSDFIKDFETKVKEINSVNIESNNINRAPNFYESTLGLLFAIFLIIILLVLTIVMIKSKYHISNIAAIIAVYFGALYYIFEVYNHRKNK